MATRAARDSSRTLVAETSKEPSREITQTKGTTITIRFQITTTIGAARLLEDALILTETITEEEETRTRTVTTTVSNSNRSKTSSVPSSSSRLSPRLRPRLQMSLSRHLPAFLTLVPWSFPQRLSSVPCR